MKQNKSTSNRDKNKSEYGELGQSKDSNNKGSKGYKDYKDYMDRLKQDHIRDKEHYQRGYQTTPNNPTSSALVHILIFLTFAIITAYLLSTWEPGNFFIV